MALTEVALHPGRLVLLELSHSTAEQGNNNPLEEKTRVQTVSEREKPHEIPPRE